MITNDTLVENGLYYLLDGDKSEALHHQAMVKEQAAKRIFAEQTKKATGPIELRKAEATTSAEYQEAISEFAKAEAQLRRHLEMREAAKETNKIWLEEQWQARAAEKIR